MYQKLPRYLQAFKNLYSHLRPTAGGHDILP